MVKTILQGGGGGGGSERNKKVKHRRRDGKRWKDNRHYPYSKNLRRMRHTLDSPVHTIFNTDRIAVAVVWAILERISALDTSLEMLEHRYLSS